MSESARFAKFKYFTPEDDFSLTRQRVVAFDVWAVHDRRRNQGIAAMAYSSHLRLLPVTDPDHIRRICAHYDLELEDVGEMRCALGNRSTDPAPPWEVIVADFSTVDEYKQRLNEYPRPELVYHWVVGGGRKQRDIGMEADPERGCPTADMVQKWILEKYVIAKVFSKDVLQDPEFGQPDAAVAAVCRRMRQNGIPNLVMLGDDFTDESMIRAIGWKSEELPDTLRVAAIRAARRLLGLVESAPDHLKEAMASLDGVSISDDGLVAVHGKTGTRIVAVDTEDRRMSLETVLMTRSRAGARADP